MKQIICREVSLSYDGCVVSENVNFSVARGDYLCIVGENGSGKSTLMKALLRLKAPEKGQILLGDGVSRMDIGYLPQQSEAKKDFPASVEEIVLSGCQGRCGFRPLRHRQLLDRRGCARRGAFQRDCHQDSL